MARVALFPNATLLAQAWTRLAAEQARCSPVKAALRMSMSSSAQRSTCTALRWVAIRGVRRGSLLADWPLATSGHPALRYRGLRQALCRKRIRTQRRTVDARVSEAALRELYLLPFEICVADAHPWTIMAAYNDVNGVPATEQDQLNNGVLKSEWGGTAC